MEQIQQENKENRGDRRKEERIRENKDN